MKSLLLCLLCLFSLSSMAKEQEYFVILSSFKQPETLDQGAVLNSLLSDIQMLGLRPYFIKTSDYPPLSEGLWSMVLGRFDKETAQEKLDQVRHLVGDAYIKRVQPLTFIEETETFAIINSSIRNEDCFVIDQDIEYEGYERLSCSGRDGYQLEKIYADTRVHVLIADYEFSSANMMDSQSFPHVMEQYPITWIYGNDQTLKAVSFVLETDHNDGRLVATRYVVKLDEDEICPIQQRFINYELMSLFKYLEDNNLNAIACMP